jgi:hypothetical protein
MDKDKALKLALEALEGVVKNCWRDIPSWRLDEIKERITAIKQALVAPVQPAHISPKQLLALAQEANLGLDKVIEVFRIVAPVQEPWGFHIQFNNGKDATFKGLNHLAECEAHLESGETITMIYTTPPAAQRQWVGLTDEEIEQGCKESWVTEQAFQSAVWWAEAKLKEKNT